MTKGHKLVLAIFSRLRRRISFTALLLAFLSIAVIVVTPLSLGRNLPAAGSSVGLQKTNSSSQLTAAIASLQSGLGPLGIGPISCSATGLGSAQCETARSGQAVSASSGQAISASGVTGSWTNVTSSTHPSPREFASMTYDTADGYVILFGGSAGGAGFGETWRFLGGSWTNISPSSGPTPRVEASIAYDTADGYVILFGGAGSRILSDTWKFHGGSWTNITRSSGPSPRFEASMAYDTADGYVVAFGGAAFTSNGFTAVYGDTWKFLGGSWTNITSSTGPSPRFIASMAYDTADGYVILFGGGTSSALFGDTWKFLGGSWTNITS